MTEFLDLVVDFASSGQLGPLRCGMVLGEVQELLGPWHERADDPKPRRWRPRLYFWDDLEVVICHDVVVTILVPAWRDTVRLPRAVSGWSGPRPAMVSRVDVVAALAAAGCAWREVADGVVVGDVSLHFWPGDDAGLRLYKVIKDDHSVDLGDHSSRQGPLRSAGAAGS